MAAGNVEVGLKMTEPNWPTICVQVVGPAMAALGYLESGNVDMAKESLEKVSAVCDLLMTFRAEHLETEQRDVD